MFTMTDKENKATNHNTVSKVANWIRAGAVLFLALLSLWLGIGVLSKSDLNSNEFVLGLFMLLIGLLATWKALHVIVGIFKYYDIHISFKPYPIAPGIPVSIEINTKIPFSTKNHFNLTLVQNMGASWDFTKSIKFQSYSEAGNTKLVSTLSLPLNYNKEDLKKYQNVNWQLCFEGRVGLLRLEREFFLNGSDLAEET